MSMPIPDDDRTILLKDEFRDHPAKSSGICFRAAALARSIAVYAPAPWGESRSDRIEMSGGEDARIVWIQDLATQGRNRMEWRTRIQMWEPMPCGDSLRTLQVTLPEGISPESMRPDGMLELAGFLDWLSRACVSIRNAHPMPWLPHAIAAHATRPFSSGTMIPDCGWLPHRFDGDLAHAIPNEAMAVLGRIIPRTIVLSTSVEVTEEGMDMHDVRIRPSPIEVRPVDAVMGLRALKALDALNSNPD